MSYHEFDDFILGIGRVSEEPNGFSLAEAGLFLSNFKKLAAGVEEQPDPMGSEFAAPAPDVVQTCLAVAAQLLHAHTAYTVYATALRGPSHKALAAEFADIAEGDLADIKYFMTRANIIADGAPLQLPVVPSPPALDDEVQMIQHIITGSDRLISLLKTLRVQVGEHPMKYTVESQIDGEQTHHDRLVQLLPKGTPHTAAAPQKVASLLAAVKRASAESVVNTEVVGAMQQAQQESAFFQQQVAAQQQATAGVQQQLEQVSAQAQQAQQQLQMVQQQADMSAQQAQMATQQAQQAQTEAAANAESKMRLAMRIQQFRQQIADALATDPVQEEGASPEAGMPTTQTAGQQQAAAEQQAQEQAAAAQQQGGAPGQPATAKSQKEVEQAQRAQEKAQIQTQQAEQATQEDATKAVGKTAAVVLRLKSAAAGTALAARAGARVARQGGRIVTHTNIPEAVALMVDRAGAHALSTGVDAKRVADLAAHYKASKPLPPQLYGRRAIAAGASLGTNARKAARTAAGALTPDARILTNETAVARNIKGATRPNRPPLRRGQAIDLKELAAYAKARGHDVSGIKTSGRIHNWIRDNVGDALAEGLAKNPENTKAVGGALAQGMADNRAALTSMAETTGHSFGSQASKAMKDAEVLEKATEMAGKIGRGARNVAIGAGVLGTGYLAHKGLQHAVRLRGQAQEARRLDQQERMLAALEARGHKSPHSHGRIPSSSPELPGAPVRNTIQPKFSSNTDVGTMS